MGDSVTRPHAANAILESESFPAEGWHFYCDNQGAVKTLDSPEVNSNLIADCSHLLSEIGERVPLTLHWIKAHVGYAGNERADTLAKLGTKLPNNKIEKIPIPRSYVKRVLESATLFHWNQSWNASTTLYRQTKEWLGEIQPYYSQKLIQLDRETYGKVIQLITGHCYLRYHQNKCCLLYTSPSPRDGATSRMPSSA